jgi:predicted dehydrogenase
MCRCRAGGSIDKLGVSGSHIVDQVRTWLGEFASLSAALPVVSERAGDVAEDSFVIRFRLRSGLEGVLQQCGGAWGLRSLTWRVAGDKETV